MVETNATCGFEMATFIQVAHEIEEQSKFENLSKYDVFLNHRGPDVKKSFVSHLDAALRRFGREPFLDAKSLIKGRHAFNSINEALSGVYCHVAIFSPHYAESKYCLNELCDMLASKKPIFPIFYNVEPEDLRWPEKEKGPFVKAFNHHMERGRNQDVMKWKEALRKAADIAGFKLVDSDNEVKLVEKVTSAVLKALPPPPPMVSARHPVGLKKSLAHVVGMLHKMGESVGVLGIHGMGGIGKTTLAKEIYNYGEIGFQKRCFLRDIKDAKGTALMDLQMQLVKDLLGEDVKKMVGDYARCIEMIGKYKVLIVADDVSSRKQFCEIIPDINLLAPGSQVVITCRAIDILNDIMLNVPQRALHGMEELSLSNSLELFIWCAFQKVKLDDVEDSFHESVNMITKACGGVPLALEVMGGFLVEKKDDRECWIKATSALKNHPDVMTWLKISYEGLVDEDDKSIFVDIACFMLGHPKDIALAVWDSIDEYNVPSWSLRRLMDKGLVKIVDGGLLNMHDLLRDMGRNIVKEMAKQKDGKQSHIWDPSQATKIIRNEEGLKRVLALSLIGADPSITWKAESFVKMKKLRYLFLDGCLMNGDFSRWPEELRWLQWRYFRGDEIPRGLRLSNLVVLNLANSYNLTHLWTINFEEESPCKNLQVLILTKCTNLKDLPHQIEKLVKLKLLNLKECKSIISLPSSLGYVKGLQELYLSGCDLLHKLPTSISKLSKLTKLNASRTAIEELPTDFGQLDGLKKVSLIDCKSLRELPESFGGLSNLEVLHLGGCKLLQKLPTSISKLSKLMELDIRETALQELPMDFGQLDGLKKVWFVDCKSLRELPESFGGLSNLEVLNLGGCELLQKLPTSISKLSKLMELNIRKTALQELPMDFGQLDRLKEVWFVDCKNLRELPESFGGLSNLEVLDLDGCELLQKLPTSISKLSKLMELDIRKTALQELPMDFGQLDGLQKVWFVDCKNLRELPESFGGLSNLEVLNLGGCELLQKLPTSISKLSKLMELDIRETALQELPMDFGQLDGLQKVWFVDCKNLRELPESFGGLSNLEVLNLGGCELLQKLPTSISKLSKLMELNIRKTPLQELPMDFGQLDGLKKVWFVDCKSLRELPESFGGLSNLKVLDLDGCELLQKLPTSISKLSKLMELNIRKTALQELPMDFGQLDRLKEVWFVDCKNLRELPESFGGLSNLEVLDLDGCELLQKLPTSISKLSKLMELDIRETALQELPMDFGQLDGLQKVWFVDCKSLHELPESFGGLSNLEVLNLGGCELLQKLPTSISKLSKLMELDIRKTALQELPMDFGQLDGLQKVWFVDCKSLHELPESFGGLSNLRVLNLGGCELLQKLPTSISKLSKLMELNIRKTTLQELPMDFGQLDGLQKVWFVDCKSLRELPESFGGLSNLEVLNLGGCELLQKLPTSISKLSKLMELDIRKTALQELPMDFGQLDGLKKVWFVDCKSLRELPESFGGLSNLEVLDLDGCELLEKLPTSICKLSKLMELDIRKTALQELPMDFDQLDGLQKVWFVDCKNLHELPESFGGLSNLEVLNLGGCELLQKLPTSISKLSMLMELDIEKTALQELPMDFGQLDGLQKVWFVDCKSLRELPESFGGLSNLEVLNLGGCELLQKLPTSISKLSKLMELDIRKTALQELPMDFGQLDGLKKVWFVDCKSLRELPESFGGLSNLEVLDLDGCELLQKLPTSISKLSKLSELDVERTAIQEFPMDYCQFGGLKRVLFINCRNLYELPESFGGLNNLEELWLDGCHLLHSLPLSFSKLSKLTRLYLQDMALEVLPNNFGELCSLEELYLSYSISLRLLPLSISALCNLEVLHLDGCSLLQTIPPSICQLKKLKEICLNYMVLTELPEAFSQLHTLRQVDLEGCNLLHTLCETFGYLTKLQKLNLKGCRSLIRLPESFSKLENLEELDLRGCGLLQSLPPSTMQLTIQVGGDDGVGKEDGHLRDYLNWCKSSRCCVRTDN